MSSKIIMTPEEMQRSLTRMAHEILERNYNPQNLILVGMRTRGVPLAERLANNISRFEPQTIPIGALDFSLYRDDLNQRRIDVKTTDIPATIVGKNVILVDDVLYTGRSTRAAIDALIALGRPENIQLAVLVDRGHRELPIRADYVGKNIPSSRQESIKVHLKETDGFDEVVITTEPGNE